ncbi:MAG: hypothetical protein KQI81_09245 [Deltaproteobacteria bacterium]|nr:hypothetical protein [Deltaproteobacteria bacterium]
MRTDNGACRQCMESTWARGVLTGLLFLVTLLIIYWPGFTGEWHYDDYYNILDNKNVQIESLDAKSLRKTLYLGDPEHGGRLSRPLAYFSFAINYYLGKKQVVGYHIVNFAIHLSASIFLYLFIQHTLNLPLLRITFGGLAHPVALLAAFIWAIHPIHVTAVTYIVQRMASMAGLFYIFTLYSYARGRTVESSLGKWAWLAAAALSALLALATKQNSAMIPLSIFFYEWILVQGVGRLSLKRVLAFGFPALAMLALMGWVFINPETFLGSYAKIRPYTPLERVLTQPRVIWQYLSLLFYPTQSRLTLLHDIQFSTSLGSPWTTLPAMISLIAIFIIALFWGARRQPLAAFCIIFFMINHAIEGSFLNLELIYEHRNYIPSMLLFIVPAVFIIRMLRYFSYTGRLQRVLIIGMALFFSVIGHTTYGYNSIFSNDRLMWADNIAKFPGLSIPHNNYGSRLWDQGLFEKALESYTHAKAQDHYFNLIQKGMVHYNIGLYYSLVANDPKTALGYFETALAIAPNNRKIWLEYAKSLGRVGDWGAGETVLRNCLKRWPLDSDMYAVTELYHQNGRFGKSEDVVDR